MIISPSRSIETTHNRFFPLRHMTLLLSYLSFTTSLGLYIDDFRQTSSNQVIALRDVNILRDVDVTQCAKTCVENLGSECKGFDFCGNETFCVLSSKYYRDKGIGKVVTADRAVCSHYSSTYGVRVLSNIMSRIRVS